MFPPATCSSWRYCGCGPRYQRSPNRAGSPSSHVMKPEGESLRLQSCLVGIVSPSTRAHSPVRKTTCCVFPCGVPICLPLKTDATQLNGRVRYERGEWRGERDRGRWRLALRHPAGTRVGLFGAFPRWKRISITTPLHVLCRTAAQNMTRMPEFLKWCSLHNRLQTEYIHDITNTHTHTQGATCQEFLHKMSLSTFEGSTLLCRHGDKRKH